MILLTLVAILLRFVLLLQPEPFWYDETFSYMLAKLPTERLLTATAYDVHPPAYYLLLSWWLRLWPDAIRMEFAARSLSFVLSIIALVLYRRVLGLFTLTTAQRRAAWIVTLFLPGIVYYAAEARMYALLECYVLAVLVAIGRSHPSAVESCAGGMCVAGAALTHNAGIIWGGLILLVVYVITRDLRRVVIAGVVAAIGYAVWIPAFMSQLVATSESFWVWSPTLGTTAYMQFLALVYSPWLLDTGIDCVLMLLVSGLTTFGVIALARRWPASLILTIGFPVAAFIGSYVLGAGFMLHRLLLPGAFFIAIAWAVLLTRRDVGPALSVMLAAALIFVNVQSLIMGRSGTDYSEVMAQLTSRPADIIYGNNSAILPVSLYSGIPAVIMSGYVNPMGSGLTQETIDAIGVETANLDRIPWERAWILSFITPGSRIEDEQYMLGMVAMYGGSMLVKTESQFYHWELHYVERYDN